MSSNVPVAPPLVKGDPSERLNWQLSIPFFIMHLLPLGALWFHPTWVDWAVCVGLYGSRMFFITGVYHRYFAHRGYKAGRLVTFLLAFGGGTCAQKGALWWASHHRWHHRFSDTDRDPHQSSRGFWWSHVLWILCDKYNETHYETIKDFAKYPELVFLNKHHLLPPVALGFVVWLVGGWSMLFTGFFLSTVLLYHGTFSINSLTHRFGRARYKTGETSKNSFLLALVTLGEGWHNNHHYYSSTANQGFFWWELDISYYVLRVLSWVGLVSDLRVPTDRARFKNWIDIEARDRLLARYGVARPEDHTHDDDGLDRPAPTSTAAPALSSVPPAPAE
jgi:stearoyl-CoA desaturase (delta-9 desaturase)